ncbi:nickel/cobalt transporter [Photobacterium kagoshimensis]|uniref:nickel/cobalt transporter n=1 Tax=Photobacterium kagoshimensis TaxID=2910242 RepID=UPI003D0B3195
MQSTRSSVAHWLFSVYGLLTVLSLCGFTGYLLWQAWPSLILSGMQWQRSLYNTLSELLFDAKTEPLSAGISLVSLSLLYGVLHSLGPGHGKVIVSTYVATHPAKVAASLWITLLSALMQAVVAISLVSILRFIYQTSMRDISAHADTFVTLSFYAVIVLGLGLITRSLRTIWQMQAANKHQKTADSAIQACCHHHASAASMNQATSKKELVSIIASIGIRPCTGAIMVLLFANMVDMYWLGVISAMVMAVGTAITTSTLAMMTISGKKLVQFYLNRTLHRSSMISGLRPAIQIIGGVALVILGMVMLQSQVPGMSTVF